MKKNAFTLLSVTMLFLMLMCSCSTERNNAEKEEGTKSESENYSDDSNISEALSYLKLIPSDVSDSNGINLSEKMMNDYISYIGSEETFCLLGKCDSQESDILKNGYAFITSDQTINEYIGHFYYAIPEKSALYECNVNSELFLCWKNNLPVNADKATQFIENVISEDVCFENVVSDGFYAFNHNNRILYVNWECTQILVRTDKGVKALIYPTDTVGYFQ